MIESRAMRGASVPHAVRNQLESALPTTLIPEPIS